MDARRLVLGAAAVAAGVWFSAAARAEAPAAGLGCASVTASVRMQAYGYAHVVTLVNRCQRSVTCEVWTNVDPTPRATLRAGAGESAEVVTRTGSPAREFRAEKQCRYADAR